MPVIVSKGGGAGIEGLDKFRRELNKLDPEMKKEIKAINIHFSERVAAKARDRTTGIAHHFKDGIIASKRGTSVFVGVKETPGIFGAEFGGGLFGPGHPTAAGGHTTQFGPHRGREAPKHLMTVR